VESDFIIVGAGIAGAAAGYHLAPYGRVTLLEMEPVAGYHSTGRSAALFSEYYGGPVSRALTAASRAFLTTPPAGFADHPLLHPRGTLIICPADADEAAEAEFETARAEGRQAPVPVRDVDPAQVSDYCPVLRPEWIRRAILRPGTQDIDVDALHQGFLRGVTTAGGSLVRRARVQGLHRRAGRWHARTDAGEFTAPVVVNAAGAWADEVARLAGVAPVGLTPRRRTAFVVDTPPGTDASRWPLVADSTDTFYFKPESGGLLVSPNDATPSAPVDARPDDLDVAIGAERVQQATTLRIRHIRRAWAGLRTFTPDEAPVLGPAPGHEGFHWLAALVTGTVPADPGIDPARVAADRFADATAG
jgi:D-arginine dehydrogenase